MSERYMAEECVAWIHPADRPPPHGVKLLLYLYPGGTTIVGQWQHSGAALWAPLPKVPTDLKRRLEGV